MEALVLNRRKFFTGAAALAIATPLCLTATGCDTSWIAVAEKDIPVIANIVSSLAGVALTASGNGLLTPAVQAIIQAATAAAQTGLTTLQQIITDNAKNPNASVIQKIETTIADIGVNLSSILSNFNVKDSALLQTISAGIALALATLSSIQLLIPVTAVTPGPLSAKKASQQKLLHAPVKMIDAATLKSMYNSVCIANGYGQHQVQ